MGVDSGGRQWANQNQEKGQSRKREMWGESEQTEEEREERGEARGRHGGQLYLHYIHISNTQVLEQLAFSP